MKLTLGTLPTILRKFTLKGSTNVFACSDRPTIIHSLNQKLAFSNVNLKMVNYVTQLNCDFYKDCLILTDGENLIIGNFFNWGFIFLLGKIDDIQKLHTKTVQLGESVSRIAYQKETSTIALLTSRVEVDLKIYNLNNN